MSHPQAARIIIADDHAVVRTGMQLILDETSDLSICCEVSNGTELMHQLLKAPYDLLILDASMPGRDGLDLLKEVKTLYPQMPVVIFTMNGDDHYAIRMIKAGAAAYIQKETQPSEIIHVLRTVIGGKRYFFPHQAELLAEMVSDPHRFNKLPHELLTDREFQIMFMLASGLKTNEIADKTALSRHTVANHRTHILKKMGMEGNAEITRYAIQQGIIK